MIVVSDSSPLIALASVGCFDFLSELYPSVHVPTEVYNEVVVAGAGLPGASEVANAQWIQVTAVADSAALRRECEATGLGAGELGVIHLARELGANVVLIDERKARRLAEKANLITFGCIGILEMLHEKGLVADLPQIYQRLLNQDFRIDINTLHASLRRFGLKPL